MGGRAERIGVRSLSDGINPSTREGRLMLNLMATFTEYKRELIQERVRPAPTQPGPAA
ncbi:recombinase family protein [Sinomonas halotolerans]|uniref:Recombinase family protein n=1 Tax=Sinomonas halotolerans TaxID=1644133 RepID=A0ABU9X3G4_9MICC